MSGNDLWTFFFSLWNFVLIFDTGKTGLLLHTNVKRQTDPYDTFTTWQWRSKQKHKTKNIIDIETNCPIFRFENKPSWGAKRKRSLSIDKIGIDLSIVKSIKIGKFDLIDIDCNDQSVEIDDTLVSFIDLSRFYRFHRFLSEDTSVLLFIKK